MLQYIFIHVEASNTMDRKPLHPKPCIENDCVQNHGPKTIASKTMCKNHAENHREVLLDPIEWAYLHPSNPLWRPPPDTQSAQQRGGDNPPPPQTPQLTTWASRGKNITQPNIFLPFQVLGILFQLGACHQ